MYVPNDDESDKPKLSRPKPVIASKPKHVPPVNLKVIPKQDLRIPANGKEQRRVDEMPRTQAYPKESGESRRPEPQRHQSCKPQGAMIKVSTRPRNGHDEFKTKKDFSNGEKMHTGAPNSPSTVCCSILSNTSDCCNIMGKKEMESKSMTKIDSLDSNSSDSGGFRDFIQLETVKKLPIETENGKPERKFDGHIRKFSQPEFLEKSVAERAKTLSQSLCERKSTEHVYQHRRDDSDDFRKLSKQNLVQHLTPIYTDKTDDTKNVKVKPLLINQGQFKQSTKKLEEVLAHRLEMDKQRHRRGASCHETDSVNQGQFEQQMNIQKEFQQKLQADLKQTVKQIQEIQSIELRLPQNRSWDEVCSLEVFL